MKAMTTNTMPGELSIGCNKAQQNPRWRVAAWGAMLQAAGSYAGPARHPKARDQEKTSPSNDHPFKRNYEI